MARRRALTDEEVAEGFINHGRNMAYYGFMEVVYAAARLEQPLEDAVTAHEKAVTFEEAAESVAGAAWRMAEAAGARRLIAAVVKRFAFMSGGFGEGEDGDPGGARSRHVAELLLKHAAEDNRRQDEPLPGDEDEAVDDR